MKQTPSSLSFLFISLNWMCDFILCKEVLKQLIFFSIIWLNLSVSLFRLLRQSLNDVSNCFRFMLSTKYANYWSSRDPSFILGHANLLGSEDFSV